MLRPKTAPPRSQDDASLAVLRGRVGDTTKLGDNEDLGSCQFIHALELCSRVLLECGDVWAAQVF